jgi:alpha-1,2-mannosyltransferase
MNLSATHPSFRLAPGVVRWSVPAVVALAMTLAALVAADTLPDLRVYVGAVHELRIGHGLYGYSYHGVAPFTYPPFAGLIMLPLSYAPFGALSLAWSAATIAIVIGIAHLCATHLDLDVPARLRPWVAPAIATLLFASATVSSNLHFGQVSVMLGAAMLADFTKSRDTRWAGVLTGVAAAIKLTPLLFIPLWWFAGRRRAAVTAAVTFGGLGALSAAILPGESKAFWGTYMFDVNRLGYVVSGGNQSFNGALLRLGVSDHLRSPLYIAVGAVVAVIALRRAARLTRRGEWLSAVVVVGAASVVASPVSWTHHQIWLVLAVLLPVAGTVKARWAWRVAVAAVAVLPVTSLALSGSLGSLTGDARLLLALVIATIVPLTVRGIDRSGPDLADPVGGRGNPSDLRREMAGSAPRDGF